MDLTVPFVKKIVPKSKYPIKCPHIIKPTRIVVHNTANDATALGEISYMTSNNLKTSFHYAVDDKQIVQGIYETRNSWNAGDGAGKGNMEGISIEICYSKSGGPKFAKAEQNSAKLIAWILKRYKWNISKVTKHQDYSGKYCPHRTLDLGWDRFLKMVAKEMLPVVPPVQPPVQPPVVTPPISPCDEKIKSLEGKIIELDKVIKGKNEMIIVMNNELSRYSRFSGLLGVLEKMFPIKSE